MANEIATMEQFRELDLANPTDAAGILVKSGYFSDVRSLSQAAVKIMAGRELGIPAFAAMQGIDVVEGNLRLRSNLLASLVKASERYDYRVREWTATLCRIEFFQLTPDGSMDSLGFGEFNDEDRERAGLALKTRKGYASVWGKHPRAMFFARAMSNGVSAHCPDVGNGIRIYTEGDSFGPTIKPATASLDALNEALDAPDEEQPPEQPVTPAEVITDEQLEEDPY